MADAQHGGILQLGVEQAHDVALAVFVERGGRFVEKDPTWLVQEEAREGEALLLAERQLAVPPFDPVELVEEIAEVASLERLSHSRRSEKASGGLG